MKINVSPEELQGAHDHAVEGSIMGALIGTGASAAASALLWRFSPVYRQYLSPSGKVALVVIAGCAGMWIGGDKALLKYDREVTSKKLQHLVEEVPYVHEPKKTLLDQIKEHRYHIIAGVWGVSMVGALAASFSERNLKLSQKIVHARMYAQFATISALLGTALLVQFDPASKKVAHPSAASKTDF